MSFFTHPTAAQRYRAARPYFHPLVVEIIRQICGLDDCENALDVGCGTGQSTVALTALARHVIGLDISQAMLDQAMPYSGVRYIRSPAEMLPFANESFDLLTAGLAFHWLDRQCFLPEAHRVLQHGSWLALYNDWFCGSMAENTAFQKWCNESYLKHYPTPPRNREPLTDGIVGAAGFEKIVRAPFAHQVVFSPETLVAYLLTQSNVIATVEQGDEGIQSVADWLLGQVGPMFTSANATFEFAGVVEACRKP